MARSVESRRDEMPTLTASTVRKLERLVHLGAGGALLAYIYAPFGEPLGDAIRFAILPVLTMSGIAMWQAPRLRRILRAGSRAQLLRR
jgi:hypothetical protein